jgi:hypothetical protein
MLDAFNGLARTQIAVTTFVAVSALNDFVKLTHLGFERPEWVSN